MRYVSFIKYIESRQQISFDEYVQQVRDGLSSAGLPLNGGWQPTRADIQVFYADKHSVNHVVKYYTQRNLRRYEKWVNGESKKWSG